MNKRWSDEELLASVNAYKRMLALDLSGEKFNKIEVYRNLAGKFGRTAKAFEYRMQNISSIYAESGENWVVGLKPANHIGTEMRARLHRIIKNSDSTETIEHHEAPPSRTWEYAIEAVTALGGSLTRAEALDWITSSYPDYNTRNIIDLEMLSVNSPSRASHSFNSKPRRADSGNIYDRLFKIGHGKSVFFEWYIPSIHGVWELYSSPSAGNRYGIKVRLSEPPVPTALISLEAQAERESFFSPENIEDAREKILSEIYRRRGQAGFRKALNKAYAGRCAITGCTIYSLLEAAHIHPYKGPQTNVAPNGLLLRTDIHTLFDLYLITIDPESMTAVVAPTLESTEYAYLAGRKVFIPLITADRPSAAALAWHYALCDWTQTTRQY